MPVGFLTPPFFGHFIFADEEGAIKQAPVLRSNSVKITYSIQKRRSPKILSHISRVLLDHHTIASLKLSTVDCFLSFNLHIKTNNLQT